MVEKPDIDYEEDKDDSQKYIKLEGIQNSPLWIDIKDSCDKKSRIEILNMIKEELMEK